MILSEKLSLLRKQNGLSQEELADKLNIARQTVSKWENGLAIPELDALIGLSKLYGISLDRIVKDDDECNRALKKSPEVEQSDLVSFLIRAKQKTYAGHGAEVTSSRPASHDLRYEEGNLLYIDTFLGGEKFTGEEALWKDGIPLWSMNYSGRVTGENFSGDFLKEALFNVPAATTSRQYKTTAVLTQSFITFLDENNIHYKFIQKQSNWFLQLLINLLPIFVLFALYFIFFRKMSGGSGGGMGSIFGAGQSRAKAVEEGKVNVDISVILEYGCNIREVTGTIQERVKSSIETMTGLEVAAVDVIVADVDAENE